MEFQAVWKSIANHAGEEFFTITNLPFTYKIVNERVVPNRTNYPLSKDNFEKAMRLGILQGPGQISGIVRGPSYVFAILTDKRIR